MPKRNVRRPRRQDRKPVIHQGAALFVGEGGGRIDHPRRITDDSYIPPGGAPTVLTKQEIPRLQAELLCHWRDLGKDQNNANSVRYLKDKRIKEAPSMRKAWEEASREMMIRKVVRPARDEWERLNK
jgi:hypothetical protein